jgi:hypothetical protein
MQERRRAGSDGGGTGVVARTDAAEEAWDLDIGTSSADGDARHVVVFVVLIVLIAGLDSVDRLTSRSRCSCIVHRVIDHGVR